MPEKKEPVQDFGGDAQEAHLEMLLENCLDLYGRPATIWLPKVDNNEYAHVYDDLSTGVLQYVEPTGYTNPEPSGQSCRVLLGQPVRGLSLNDFISLSDKVETEIKVTTNVKLEPETIIEVSYPHNRKMKLKIQVPMGVHSDSFIIFTYIGIVQ